MIPHDVNLSRIRDDNLRIRLERAWSWIDLAQSHKNSAHARFIFYWIAFNAIYGLEPLNQEDPPPDQMKQIRKLLEKLKGVITICGEKERGLLYQHIHKMRGSLEDLIKDSFLIKEYWVGQESPRSVTSQCASDWGKTHEQMRTNCLDFDKVFHIPCGRLLVLRNQIVHGSARGDDKSRGHPSLERGLAVIEKMVPAFFDLLTRFEDPSEKWPKAPYPRWGHPEHPHEYTEGEPHELLGNRPKSN
ncbi:MAG: hypothetical protein F4X63_07425 [Nitrospira sp. SB0662_bin_26]|nr:hypothetical protein [Nitrospira sp. SB0662_bin_26]